MLWTSKYIDLGKFHVGWILITAYVERDTDSIDFYSRDEEAIDAKSGSGQKNSITVTCSGNYLGCPIMIDTWTLENEQWELVKNEGHSVKFEAI